MSDQFEGAWLCGAARFAAPTNPATSSWVTETAQVSLHAWMLP
jgi:hypothetical protein